MNGANKIARHAALLLCLAILTSSSALATQGKGPKSEIGALKEEISQLRSEIEAMRNELRVLSQRIVQQPPARRVSVSTKAGVPLGNETAPVTLVEFSDYQCPFCRRFNEQTLSKIKAQYIETGKVRYVFRDFPLDSIHPQARKASQAALCAGDQGKYWEAHHLLFQNQQRLKNDDLKSYAQQLGLNTETFNECLDKDKHASRIQENVADAIRAGVRGTPAFVLGRTGRDGVIDGLFISGAKPFEEFQQEIERLLADKQ